MSVRGLSLRDVFKKPQFGLIISALSMGIISVAVIGDTFAQSVTVQGEGTAPTATATAQDGAILLEWEEKQGAQKYRYRYRQVGGSWSSNIQVQLSEPRSVTIGGLTNGVDYTVAVGTRINNKWKNHWTEITLAPGNSGPPVNSDPDITLPSAMGAIKDEVTMFDATVVDDGLPEDPGTVSYTWSQTSGPGTAVIATPNAEDTEITFDQLGEYVIALAAFDGELISTHFITVTVGEPSDIGVSNLPIHDYTVELGLKATPNVNTSSFSKPCIMDLDEDGILDSIWSVHKSEPLNVYYGDGDGTFSEVAGGSIGIQKHDNHGCIVEDFDNDGDLDVFGPQGACQGTCFKRDRLWLQNANGNFSLVTTLMGPLTKDRARDTAAADFNNDGWMDLLITASAKPGVNSNHRVQINNGNNASGQWQGFSTPETGIGDSKGNSSCAAAEDLDGDGWQDILYCNVKNNHALDGLRVYRNDQDTTFSDYGLGFDTKKVRGVSTSDVNGDQLPDLLLAYVNKFELRLNQGGGNFGVVNLEIPLIFGHEVVTPDFDGDGDLDIMIIQALSDQDPSSDGAHMLFLNRNGDATAWDKNLLPQTPRGAGDKAEVFENFLGTNADAVFIGNGGQWDTKGPRQVLALDYTQSGPGRLDFGTTVFNESATNTGDIDNDIVVKLSGDKFSVTGGALTAGTHYSIGNLPAGLSETVTVNAEGTEATISLSGTATSHENPNDVSALAFTFEDAVFEFNTYLSQTPVNANTPLDIDFNDPSSLSYSATTFNEVAANDGSIENSIVASVVNDTFSVADGQLTEGTHYTIANVPAGLTATVTTNAAATDATITLSGNATAHESLDDVANLNVTFNAAAFTNPLQQHANSSADFAVDFDDEAVLSYDRTDFVEALVNDGSVDNDIIVTLTGDTFSVTNGPLVAGTHYTVSNVPAGMSEQITTNQQADGATISLVGNATTHENANDVSDLSVQFLPAAFTNQVQPHANDTVTASVDFADQSVLSYSGTNFVERAVNDGSVENNVTITLTGDTFSVVNGPLVPGTHYNATNVPAGLNESINTNLDGTEATLSFVGNALAHENVNDVSDLNITFTAAAFGNTLQPHLNDSNNFSVDFDDVSTLTYSATTFDETAVNDGSSNTSVTITLTGDTFSLAGGPLVAGTHYTAGNVPAGMTESLVTNAQANEATFTLTGSASAHEDVDDVLDLNLTFLSDAFVNPLQPHVGDNTDFAVDFRDASVLSYDRTDFVEAIANDGSVDTSVVATLTGDTFSVTNGNLVAGTHYNVSNVPAGLTETVTIDAAGLQATITLGGNANNHENVDDVSNLNVTFLAAAFTNTVQPHANDNQDFSVDFEDAPSLSFDATIFDETVVNNGSIANSIVATLSGNTFSVTSGPLTAGTHYTITNLPAGLVESITINQDGTEATITLTGNALAHADIDDISNLNITFEDAAFTDSTFPGQIPSNASSNFTIDFDDPVL